MRDNKWIDFYREKQGSRYRLFCIPYAGGAASKYAVWRKVVPDFAEILPVQLPGRESRIREPLPKDLMDLSWSIAEQIARFSKDGKPYSVFGHSMGGVIAFEVVKALEKMGEKPDLCFISATDLVSGDTLKPISEINDDQFLDVVSAYGALDEMLLLKKFPRFFQLVMKIMRSDFEMLQNYTIDNNVKIHTPIHAYSYREDRLASPELMKKWMRFTEGGYQCKCYPGDHFYLFHESEPIVNDIFETIKRKEGTEYGEYRQLARAI